MVKTTNYDFLTIYRGRNPITYLADEFYELGENATPYAIRQNPSENTPFHKFELKDADAIGFFSSLDTTPQDNDLAKWDVKALERLLESANDDGGK